jgi:transcriptional regulator with XRE-family HTH domain
MLIDKETLRLIFGLKLRSLREDKKLSLKDLAKKTGLSPSYLNEIEKGKKYPKTEKIILLANALEEKYESLISLELKKEFRLLQNLMDRKILKALPFDVFGIPINTLFELIAEEPDKLSAFVGTILEIARAHNIQIDDIFYALLRSYIDMNGNYFLAIEEHAKNFRDKYKLDILISPNELKKSLLKVLESELKVKVIEEELFHNGRKLTKIFYYILDQGRELHISNEIGIEEQIFILAREIGYRVQKLEIRPKSSLIAGLDSFAQLYNHFSASYFASSLLIPEHLIIEDCKNWFNQENWKIEELLTIIHKYNAPTESLFHRITQILPQHFGINHLFFLRYEYDIKQEKYEIARELHLSSLHGPHRIKGHEQSCA